MRLGGEKTGAETPNNFDAVAAEDLKNTHGIDDEVIGSRVIDGAQVIPNQSFTSC
jgi:hypothetical protein